MDFEKEVDFKDIVTGQLLTAYRVREGHDISTAGRSNGVVQRGMIQGRRSIGNSFTAGSQINGSQRVVDFLKP